ncbi:MAG: SPOR domain-containing protein [Proteobacteria bacterium]|nr:SPOR domain-containing protein [Pseudomonadota bacterium]
MKKYFTGIIILSIVIVATLTVIAFDSFKTPKKPPTQIVPSSMSEDKNQEVITVGVGVPQDITVLPSMAAKIPADPPIELNTTFEQSSHAQRDSEPIPMENGHLQPDKDQPSQKLGLLTDTGETEENQISEPFSTQVTATDQRQARRKTQEPAEIKVIRLEQGIEIAIIPEGTYPFSILLETLNNQANAQQAVAIYHKQGLKSFWVKVDLGKTGVKYRLFTGIFPTKAAAKNFLTRSHLPDKPIKNTPYSSQIGIFHEKDELVAAFAKTAESDACPYVLGIENGPFFLYVGAFYTSLGAESQCRDLVDKGLPCKLIPRSTLPPR